ncbi:PilT domain-containing protein [Calothrix sp. NIES-4071]|nr:PilT domain-containing protein [Calothrix sp. NIES-4071]BAZ60691.1 PilT domain-containing protein [Calothrix sp. NIES-4105]
MKLLLDTHVLIWYLADDPKLPSAIRDLIVDPHNHVFVSVATVWEIAIKKALGKLSSPDNLPEVLVACAFEVLQINIFHALEAGALPRHHDDPFDRMLVAQAILEGLTLATSDSRIPAYNISILTV